MANTVELGDVDILALDLYGCSVDDVTLVLIDAISTDVTTHTKRPKRDALLRYSHSFP